MFRTVCVAGLPGAGKTALIKSLLPAFGPADGPVRWRTTANLRRLSPITVVPYPAINVALMGIYDDSPYGGTDRFGPNVPPVAEAFVHEFATRYGRGADAESAGWTLLFEGDRLTNARFLDACRAEGSLRLFVLFVEPGELERRRVARAASADARWFATRATKLFHATPGRTDRDRSQDETRLRGRETRLNTLLGRYAEQTIAMPNNTVDQQNVARSTLLRTLRTRDLSPVLPA